MDGKKKIAIMIGSDSDLKQCLKGFIYLEEMVEAGSIEVVEVITNSIYRNTEDVLRNLVLLTGQIDCLIVGAGKANHLTGTCDQYYRNALKDDKIPVIGVAFEGKTWEETLAAILSIEQVPGTQVIFDRELHVGEAGFLYACQLAVTGAFEPIRLGSPKPVMRRSLIEAKMAAEEMLMAGVK